MRFIRNKNNERGSATIEFLSMVPLVILMLMIFWQFMIAGYAVLVTQSAANEAAKVYSVTKESSEAQNAAKKIIQSSSKNLTLNSVSHSVNGRDFNMTVDVEMKLIFIPKQIVGKLPNVTFSKSINGRLIE